MCRQINDGQIETNVPFSIEATPKLISGSCQVTVDGGLLELTISGTTCTGTGGGAKPVMPSAVVCAVPPLAAGAYSVKGTTVTFTVPGSADAGFQPCL